MAPSRASLRKQDVAISEDQRLFRSNRLGSSDARRLMAGAWRALWAEKTGRTTPPDLDHVPCVQIGIATEILHPGFYTHRTGIACRPADGTMVHPEHAFIVANPDFLTWQSPESVAAAPCDTLLEAKFNTGFRSDEDLAEQYYWQIQHQFLVSGLPYAVLSVLRPSSYSTVPMARNDRDIAVLLDTLHAFWWYVENDVEPADVEPAPPPATLGARILDMSRHNEFAAWGGILVDNQEGMRAYRDAEATLKTLMPDEAQIAFLPSAGHAGVVLTRSKDGKLALRLGEVPKRHRARAEPWDPGLPGY
jgi:predicted phage-related endonuclease